MFPAGYGRFVSIGANQHLTIPKCPTMQRVNSLVVGFALRVREVSGSIPDSPLFACIFDRHQFKFDTQLGIVPTGCGSFVRFDKFKHFTT